MSSRLSYRQILEGVAEACNVNVEHLISTGIPKCLLELSSQILDDPRYAQVVSFTLPAGSTSVPLASIPLAPITDTATLPVPATLARIKQVCFAGDVDADDPCVLEEGPELTRLRCRKDDPGPPVGFEVIGGDLHVYPVPDQDYELTLFVCREVDCSVKRPAGDGNEEYVFPDLPAKLHAAFACCVLAEQQFANRNYADAQNVRATYVSLVNTALSGEAEQESAPVAKKARCFQLGSSKKCGCCGDDPEIVLDASSDDPAPKVMRV